MLLDRVKEVFKDPFPHVIIENALPEDYYRSLVKTRPSMKKILNGRNYGPNERFDMPTSEALKLDSPWGEFVRAHVSIEFFKKAMEVFSDFDLYPNWDGEVSLRCQPGVNTPSPELSSVRGPHLDNPSELYAGLFYMPADNDGGDLEIYRWKQKKFYGKLEVPRDCVELVKTVSYKPNTYVMFVNTENALHGVTQRKSTQPRYLVNVIADANRPLFKRSEER